MPGTVLQFVVSTRKGVYKGWTEFWTQEERMFVTIKGLNQVEHFVNLSQITRVSSSGKDNVHVHFADGQQPLAISDSEAVTLKAAIQAQAAAHA
jgi:hypothetical protein